MMVVSIYWRFYRRRSLRKRFWLHIKYVVAWASTTPLSRCTMPETLGSATLRPVTTQRWGVLLLALLVVLEQGPQGNAKLVCKAPCFWIMMMLLYMDRIVSI